MHPGVAPYLFVVDTDTYAGNFERNLCAYMTGHVGRCGVGEDYAALFARETGGAPLDGVMDVPDEHGHCRPASIYPTPGYFNNGLGEYFRADDPGSERKALAAYRRSVRKDAGQVLSRLRDALRVHEHGTDAEKEELIAQELTPGRCQQELAIQEGKIADACALQKITRYPAHLSVAVAFAEKPADEQIELMKKRAFAFRKLPPLRTFDGRMKRILGFRVIRQRISSSARAV